jgi:molybdopterin-containing oxidoreductase family iron-sulfur binding subunit
MHCKNPPCVDVCPSDARYKREDGIVLTHFEKCVGCQSCVISCPYGARHFIKEYKGYFGKELTPYEKYGFSEHRPGVVEGCTFCYHRVDRSKEPACVSACIVKARIFGDLDDSDTVIANLICSENIFQPGEDLDCEPSVYYLL